MWRINLRLCYLVHMVVSPVQARPLRADAARNRARILEAATEVFAERGLDVTLDEIAAHAGLGVGTVYRRFTGRGGLVEGVFGERVEKTDGREQGGPPAPPPGA